MFLHSWLLYRTFGEQAVVVKLSHCLSTIKVFFECQIRIDDFVMYIIEVAINKGALSCEEA